MLAQSQMLSQPKPKGAVRAGVPDPLRYNFASTLPGSPHAIEYLRYPSFPSGFDDSDEPYIPSHAYLVPVPRLVERMEVMGFILAALNSDVKSCVKADFAEVVRQIEEHDEQDGSPISSYVRDLQRQRRLLEQFTLERWVRAIRDLRARRVLHRHDLRKDYTGLTSFATPHSER